MAEAPEAVRAHVDVVMEHVRRLADGPLDGLDEAIRLWATDERLNRLDRQDVLTLVAYDMEYREGKRIRRSSAQRRAMRLFKSFLSTEQQAQLRRSNGYRVFVRGSNGGIYRLNPRTASVHRVEQKGKRWEWTQGYCLHDYAEDNPGKNRLPPADVSLQHLLLLSADEPAFLEAAHVNERIEWTRRAA